MEEQRRETGTRTPGTPTGEVGSAGTVGESTDIGTSGSVGASGSMGGSRSMRDVWRSGSPEEVRDEVKKLVAKGVEAVAGALKGFAETAEREDMAGQAKSAVHQMGETAKQVTGEAQTQVSGVGEKAKGLTQEARNQMSTMREELGKAKEQSGMESGGGSSPTSRSAGAVDTMSTTDPASRTSTMPTGTSTTGSPALGKGPGAPSTAERDLSAMTEEERARGERRARESDRR